MQIYPEKLLDFDKERYDYYFNYYRHNFNSELQPNLGTEIVLDMVHELGEIKTLIDLGSGTSTLFWMLPLQNVETIIYNEIYKEPVYIFHNYVIKNDSLAKCYYEILKRYGYPSEHIGYIKNKIKEFHLFDVRSYWKINTNTKFEIITQFGTFGLSRNEEEFFRCIENSSKNLSDHGSIMGANWVMKNHLIKEKSIDNHYLSTDLIKKSAISLNMKVTVNEMYKINDRDYEGILIWSLKKNGS